MRLFSSVSFGGTSFPRAFGQAFGVGGFRRFDFMIQTVPHTGSPCLLRDPGHSEA